MITAGLSSTPTCWSTTPRHLASRIRATWGARSANFGFTYTPPGTDQLLARPGKRVILLTMFYKTQRSEVAEVERAFIAQTDCEAGHGHAENVYNREMSDE
jgi:hypothetical protein